MGDEILEFGQLSASYAMRRPAFVQARSRFPIRASAELAHIAGALMSDGHIDWNTQDGNPRPKKLIFYSNDESDCRWFLYLVSRLFGINGIIVKYKSKTGFSTKESFKAVVHCAWLARALILLGIPCGDKTRRPYLVPKWVLQGNWEIKKAFLQALFSFDGSIALKTERKNAVEISLTMNKHQLHIENARGFLQQIRSLLEEAHIMSGKIHVRFCENDKYTLMLFITNQKSAINFFRAGFLNKEKQQCLHRLLLRIYLYGRADGQNIAKSLIELREKAGSDKEAVTLLNAHGGAYTVRQFEHMRRGESKIPVRTVVLAARLLNNEKYLDGLPEHFRYLISLFTPH